MLIINPWDPWGFLYSVDPAVLDHKVRPMRRCIPWRAPQLSSTLGSGIIDQRPYCFARDSPFGFADRSCVLRVHSDLWSCDASARTLQPPSGLCDSPAGGIEVLTVGTRSKYSSISLQNDLFAFAIGYLLVFSESDLLKLFC